MYPAGTQRVDCDIDVCCWGQSGSHLLTVSVSEFDPQPTFSTSRGWRLLEYAIRTSNWSLTKKRALTLQVRDPHNCDHVPVIVRLLFCFLVAGPDKVHLNL